MKDGQPELETVTTWDGKECVRPKGYDDREWLNMNGYEIVDFTRDLYQKRSNEKRRF